jgi:CubicO group peptidase (beta-lactamase class C family)
VEDLNHRLTARFASDEPGVVFALLQDGRVVHQACFGQSEIAWQHPAAADTVFAIASLSKPFTALLVLKLVGDGAIDLEGRVSNYLPGYRGAGANVCVKHLLTHTSGIPNFFLLPGFQDGPVRLSHSNQQLIDIFEPLPLQFEPGSRYGYSNSGYRLLDIIIEAVTGRRFGDVLEERVFAPAGMMSSRVLNETNVVARRATGYELDGTDWRLASPVSWSLPVGAGGIATTLDDLISFDRSLWRGELADQRIHALMETPVQLTSGRAEGMAMGCVCTTYRNEQVLSFAGGISGYSSFYGHLPGRGTSLVILSNRDGLEVYDLAREILDTTFDIPAMAATSFERPQIPKEWSGTYADTLSSVAFRAIGTGYELDDPWTTRNLVHTAAMELIDVSDPGVTVRLHEEDPRAITINYPLTWFTGYLTDGE